ncbi:MAG: hypothetical protein ACE1Z4_06310 [Gammaproteobacteria bacterium]
MTDPYQEYKLIRGWVATWVFIFSALYFFLSNGGVDALISPRALVFFVVGIFITAIMIKIPIYLFDRGVVKVLMKLMSGASDVSSTKPVSSGKTYGVFLMILQVAIAVFATKIAYEWLIA